MCSGSVNYFISRVKNLQALHKIHRLFVALLPTLFAHFEHVFSQCFQYCINFAPTIFKTQGSLVIKHTSLCFSIVANSLAVRSLPAYGCPVLLLFLRCPPPPLLFVLFFLDAALFWPFFLPAGTYPQCTNNTFTFRFSGEHPTVTAVFFCQQQHSVQMKSQQKSNLWQKLRSQSQPRRSPLRIRLTVKILVSEFSLNLKCLSMWGRD